MAMPDDWCSERYRQCRRYVEAVLNDSRLLEEVMKEEGVAATSAGSEIVVILPAIGAKRLNPQHGGRSC